MPVGWWGVKRSQRQWQDVGRGPSRPFHLAAEVCCLSSASSPPALSTEDALHGLHTKAGGHGGLSAPASTACVVPLLAHSPGSPLAPFSPSRPSLPGTPGMPGRPGVP